MTSVAVLSTPNLLDEQSSSAAIQRDACGIGVVAKLRANASNEIVRLGLKVLDRLDHRGGCGCDPATGDGAGIMIDLPHSYFQRVARERGIFLGGKGTYGSGLVFSKSGEDSRRAAMRLVREFAEREGLVFLGERRVPVDSLVIGDLAKESEPSISQVFISSQRAIPQMALERKLYVLRRILEKFTQGTETDLYLPSLSTRTFVYKGLLRPVQIGKYYLDLQHQELKSRFAIVHQRFSTNTFPSWKLAQPFRFIAHNGEITTIEGN